jgi:hypothetical protein
MMASYCLLLDCSTGTDNSEQEGVFDNVQWVSYDGGSVSNPNTQAQSLNPNDNVTFAVQVKDSSGASQSTWLQWLTAIVSAQTAPGNRASRNADNNSPFRINGKPQTFLGANINGAGGLVAFSGFDSTGRPNTSGPYFGFPYAVVVKDVPPGQNQPARNTSQYEAVIVASVTDSSGLIWQFAYDPEMDVENNT